MLKTLLFIIALSLISSQAFADYGYHTNKYGTSYWRDDSNDGNPYNNANYLGMNNQNQRSGFGSSNNQFQYNYGGQLDSGNN